MNSNFNLRLDEQLKADAFGVIESFGMTPSQFMRLVLKQVADTGSLPLSFEKRQKSSMPNELTIEAIKQGRADHQAGQLERLSADTALATIRELACE